MQSAPSNPKHARLQRALPDLRGAKKCPVQVCYEELVPHEVDVVFIEYNPNSFLSCDQHAPAEMRQGCLNYEMLLRKLLQLPNRPAVVILAMMQPISRISTFAGAADTGIGLLADYYHVPHLSMRLALWHMMRAKAPGFKNEDMRMPDGFHVNTLGHIYAADIAMHFFWHASEMLQRYEASASASDRAKFQLLETAHLYPPLQLGVEVPLTWVCNSNRNLRGDSPATRISVLKGNWTFTADDHHQQKFGYIAYDPGSQLAITWTPPPSYSAANHTNKHLALMLGYLRSYTDVYGMANITCKAGCQCAPHVINAYHTRKASYSVFAQVPFNMTRGSSECTFAVTVASNPRDPSGSKCKITAVVVIESSMAALQLGLGLLERAGAWGR
jgi:hypothetical protein